MQKSKSNFISVCIPAYEMKGSGVKYLKRLLQTIQKQKHQDFEVIISDHSDNNDLKNLVDEFKDSRFLHFFNSKNKGSSSSNLNNAIDLSNYEKIKPMFQDDFFVNEYALTRVNEFLDENQWGASSCIHYLDSTKKYINEHEPGWNDNIKNGANSIGAPSVCFFNKSDLRFDENLIWFMDTDFYYRSYLKFGKPKIIQEILIANCLHENSITHSVVTDEIKAKEYQIIVQKYDSK